MMGWWNKLVRDKKAKEDDSSRLSDKEKATARGEPWVTVINVELDPENPGQGYFELDWNLPFVQKLRDAGYTGNNDEEIVDLWFTALCRNIGEDLG